jgi:hypothetical protein
MVPALTESVSPFASVQPSGSGALLAYATRNTRRQEIESTDKNWRTALLAFAFRIRRRIAWARISKAFREADLFAMVSSTMATTLSKNVLQIFWPTSL